MKRKLLLCFSAAAAVAASALYFRSFTEWIPLLYMLSIALFAFAAGGTAAGFAREKGLLRGLVTGVLYAVGFFALNVVVNNVLLHEDAAKTAALVVCGINLLFFILLYVICARGTQKNRGLAAAAFLLGIAAAVCSMAPTLLLPYYYEQSYRFVAAPAAGGRPTDQEVQTVTDADFYVSPTGNDDGDGSLERPFASVERARDAVRALDKSGRSGVKVAVMAGEYRVSSLVFTAEDGGTEACPVTYCAYGDGEVILNGGVTLPHAAFTPVTDKAVLDRLPDGAKENVLAVDLFALGVTKEQYVRIYAIGGYHTADKYDGDWIGDIYCELFIDDTRQTVARYPNGSEYLYTGDIVFEGEGSSGPHGIKPEVADIRNPKPDVYKMDKALSDRIAGWKTTDDVWMFGYWAYDWADGSTPLGEADHENLTISPKFVSLFNPKKDAAYFFFNVLEELDVPGEWYLDRENGVLYFYPPEGFTEASAVELSLSTDNIIKAEADYLTFDGLTVKGSRGDAVSVTGRGNTVKNCLIKNVSGNALLMDGYDNLASRNEITRTGKGGIILSGGDRETLTPGNNRAEDNLVHDWSEIYETYQPAFTLNGVGNVCSHNEMYNSPHEAITYSGNDHLIEYNLIHDVNLKTDDGGAIYSGRRWDWYGTVIRYNLIYDLGADGHKPVGIYMDDALAGQSIYGNLIVNAPRFGLQLGGGQDLDVHDNIVVNSQVPISFDDRALRGLSGDESDSFYLHYRENGELWKLLWDSPWESDVWRSSYPQYAHYSDDFSNTDDPNFVLNPGNGTVKHNLLVSQKGEIGEIADTAYRYSVIEDNALFRLSALKKLFVDPEHGDYSLRDDAADLIGFEIDVPALSEFGRR